MNTYDNGETIHKTCRCTMTFCHRCGDPSTLDLHQEDCHVYRGPKAAPWVREDGDTLDICPECEAACVRCAVCGAATNLGEELGYQVGRPACCRDCLPSEESVGRWWECQDRLVGFLRWVTRFDEWTPDDVIGIVEEPLAWSRQYRDYHAIKITNKGDL